MGEDVNRRYSEAKDIINLDPRTGDPAHGTEIGVSGLRRRSSIDDNSHDYPDVDLDLPCV
jgi:hypothetical protein